MLTNIKIILVETTNSGNIGAAARAMKNMGMFRLSLVSPRNFPSADATARASGADDILATAEIHTSLQQAIAECQMVVGASARDRSISWPTMTARECALHCATPEQANTQIALVFGRENSGLTNAELDLCHYLLRIPCNPGYSSLNLAAAVQIVCYEMLMTHGYDPEVSVGDQFSSPLATAEQMESFYRHLYQTMDDIGFLHSDKSQSIMRRLRRIFNRIQLDTKELDILRGILRFSQTHNGK